MSKEHNAESYFSDKIDYNIGQILGNLNLIILENFMVYFLENSMFSYVSCFFFLFNYILKDQYLTYLSRSYKDQ